MGRPSKYKPEFAEQARKLCMLGATDKEIAEFFEVNVATINRWKAEFPEFCASLKTGKEAADERVERSLYHRATGYKHEAVKFFQAGGLILREEYVEHYPPDTTAAIFWLKNRRPDLWRDAKDVNLNVKKAVEELTDDELQRIASGSSDGTAEAAGSASDATRVH